MKTLIQWTLLVLFVSLGLFILIPSYHVLSSAGGGGTITLKEPPEPPSPPNPLTLPTIDPKLDLKVQEEQVKAHTQQVNAYTQQITAYAQQVSAYSQHISAYKTYADSSVKSPRTSAYQLVVKDTLLSLLNTFITVLLGYVFVTKGAEIVRDYVSAKYAK
jgi:hypothetical protein